MNLRYKISSCLHISITTTHLMLVFLNSPQDFVLKIIITGKKEPDFQFLIKVIYELFSLLPEEFCTFIS